MTRVYLSRGRFPARYLDATVDYIRAVQRPDGAIPWFEGGILDPWDHVEAAMGLAIGGRLVEARRAFEWLARHQRRDGSWLAAYRDGGVVDDTRAETNFVAYVATGVWHHYLISGDRGLLADAWPMVESAIEFVVSLASPHGEIYWALDTRTGVSEDALVTGSSCIYKSLECAANIALTLGADPRRWLHHRARLGHALRHKPERFDRTWESKSRYSMDWFYPVLCGVLTGGEARRRLAGRWREFVEPGAGCRCVADRPWVTVAESCELALALLAVNDAHRAAALFGWLGDYRESDGSWWTGYVTEDRVLWPDERPTWTAAAVLLAADALTGHTAASRLFTGVNLPESTQDGEGVRHRPFLEQP